MAARTISERIDAIAAARAKGFPYIYLTTNGRRALLERDVAAIACEKCVASA